MARLSSVLRVTSGRFTRTLALAAIVAAGIFVGLGTFTFVYARGYSYLQNDPQACANCHVMRENYAAWGVSAHRSLTCNDCHVPHDLVGKYLVKAEHGVAHSFAFTFQQPQTIRIKPRSLEVVEANCIACHEATVANVMMSAAATAGHGSGTRTGGPAESRRCTVCHRDAGHLT